MKTLAGFIQRRPLPVYFFLAYLFSWVFYPLIAVSPVYGLPGLFAPALAAVIVVWATGGRLTWLTPSPCPSWRPGC